MRTATKVLSLVAVVLLLGLTVTAVVSFQRSQTLNLPISKATSICAIILPLLTGLSLRGGQSLARQPQSSILPNHNAMSWTALIVVVIFTIYETVVATLSISYMAPASALTCPLEHQWQQMWSAKDAAAIRTIQDRHNCCGLHSTVDRAWPFPNKNRQVTACHDMLGREKSCFGYWRRDQQISAGLLLLVAVMCFVVKVIVLLYIRGTAMRTGRYTYPGSSGNSKDNRRGVGGDHNGTPYHDDPLLEDENQDTHAGNRKAITAASGDTSGGSQQHGPVMQPSRLHEGQGDQNAWA